MTIRLVVIIAVLGCGLAAPVRAQTPPVALVEVVAGWAGFVDENWIDRAMVQAQQPEADRGALQDTILRLAAEVRQQLGLQLNITKTLVDLKVVREFQRSVTETIAEVDPGVARQIIAKLKERRALRASGTLPALDGQGGF